MNPTAPNPAPTEFADCCESLEMLSNRLLLVLHEARTGHDVADALDDELQARLDRTIAQLNDRLLAQGGMATLADPLHIDQICAPAISNEVSEALSGEAQRPASIEAASSERLPNPFDPSVEKLTSEGLGPNRRLFESLADEHGPHALLKGTTRQLPILAVIELIGEATASGVLSLRTEDDYLSFEFMFGSIVATSSDSPRPGRRLGELVVEMGFVSEPARDQALAEAAETSTPLGSVLVHNGWLTVGQLTDALFAQTRARFERVQEATTVDFAFVVKPIGIRDGRLYMTAHDLLARASK